MVFGPGTGSPATFVPLEHITHAFDITKKSASHPQVVSLPVASSPPGLVELAGHAVHTCETTRWLAGQSVGSHMVFAPGTGSPAAFVEPAAQATQALVITKKFALQSQLVLLPVALSPAAFVEFVGQATHAFACTR